jgi:hypothetical protein
MSNKKETAVDSLRNKLLNEFGFAFSDNIFEEAKELEKQQIIDSLHYFGIENAQDYYTETYGGQNYE